MIQAIAETVFDVLYLGFALTAGFMMLTRGQTALVKKLGWMAFVLGAGDAFHLVPRSYALFTTGLEANAAALGIGKLVTSVTMTVFYLLLYAVWRDYFEIEGRKNLTIILYTLAALRIGFCLLPQNEWLTYHQPLQYGILRNVPFVGIGIILIVLFAKSTKQTGLMAFRYLPVAVALSFGFYLPVVLFSAVMPVIGMLMIPKTLAYVWMIWMGVQVYRQTDGRAS